MEVRTKLVSSCMGRIAPGTWISAGRNARLQMGVAGTAIPRASLIGERAHSGATGDSIDIKASHPGFGSTYECRRRRGNFTQSWRSLQSNTVTEALSKTKSVSSDVSVAEGRDNVSAADLENDAERVDGNVSSEEIVEKGYTMNRICDRLIEVFMKEKTTPVQWLNLLALSKEWERIRRHFFKRCRANAKAEPDPQMRRKLVKLAKHVKEVDDKMILHDTLLAEIEQSGLELDTLVARRRKDFTIEFFDYLRILTECSPKLSRKNEIATIAARCLSVVEAQDAALEDAEALLDAQMKFDEILGSPSLESAADKIDQLAEKKELDSALLLLITKAWVAAKDSTTLKQETKDIMQYLYKSARKCMQKLVPDEIDIIKYLISIEDPRDRFAALTTAFSSGDELDDRTVRRLHTTPSKLQHWIILLLDAYHSNKTSTLIKDPQELSNPVVVGRLESLKTFVENQFI